MVSFLSTAKSTAMGFRFRKSKKIGPFRITATHRSLSTSASAKVGPVRVTRGKSGTTVSVAGTGISHTTRSGRGSGQTADNRGERQSILIGCLGLVGLVFGAFVVIGVITTIFSGGDNRRSSPRYAVTNNPVATEQDESEPPLEQPTMVEAPAPVPPMVPRDTTPAIEEPEPADASPYREWVAANGNFKTKARLLDYTDSAVRLLRQDWDVTAVKMERLSADDQEFVASQDQNLMVGKVTSVSDADTITLACPNGTFRIRLNGIDAPEKRQDFGRKAATALRALVDDKKVRVRWTEQDRYKRYLGEVYNADGWVNLKMVEDGWAWHYKDYSKDPDLAKAEQLARAATRGLWKDTSEPEPPWAYRDRQDELSRIAKEKKDRERALAFAARKPTTRRHVPAPSSRSYWLNTSTNVRHNRGCRHYNSTKSGRSCTASEGTACGQCGG